MPPICLAPSAATPQSRRTIPHPSAPPTRLRRPARISHRVNAALLQCQTICPLTLKLPASRRIVPRTLCLSQLPPQKFLSVHHPTPSRTHTTQLLDLIQSPACQGTRSIRPRPEASLGFLQRRRQRELLRLLTLLRHGP